MGHPTATANAQEEMRPTAAICTANTAAADFADLEFGAFSTPNALPENLVDGWYLVAPFGEFPEPKGTYTQVFGPEQAETMIRSWNSIAGRAFRWMKNVRHRLKPALTLPIFDAPPLSPHPDINTMDFSKLRVLGEVSDLRSGNSGLEALVEWTPAARAGLRENGPLYPSGNWWHEKPDAAGKVYPEHLESITLTQTPNIRSVPAWTANALALHEAAEWGTTPNNKTANNTDKKKIIEPPGFAPGAADELISTTTKRKMKTTPEQRAALVKSKISEHMARGMDYTEAFNLVMKLPEIAEALQDAQHPQDVVEKERQDQRGAELKSAIEDKMLKHGVDARTAQKLVEGISGSDERLAAVTAAVAQLQKDNGCDYNAAWARVQRDPQFADVFRTSESGQPQRNQ